MSCLEVDLARRSHEAARSRFLSAVKQGGGRAVTYPHPSGLSVDVGTLGRASARKSLAFLSGVHGPEGPVGSALLVDALTSGLLSRLPEDTKAILIHAINPWGVAYCSRTTENNVDLNRNFIDFAAPRPENPGYTELHMQLCSTDLQDALAALQAIVRSRVARGDGASPFDAIQRGQYQYQDGIGFGGHRAEWSNGALRKIVADHLSSTEAVAFVDWHTGVGTFAEAVPMCFHEANDPAIESLRDWHDNEVTAFANHFPGGVAPKFTGLLVKALEDMLGPRRLYAVVVEFGTRPNADIVRALVIDRWLRFAGPDQSALASSLRTEMIECFCPSDSNWWDAVVPKARQIVSRTIAGLAST